MMAHLARECACKDCTSPLWPPDVLGSTAVDQHVPNERLTVIVYRLTSWQSAANCARMLQSVNLVACAVAAELEFHIRPGVFEPTHINGSKSVEALAGWSDPEPGGALMPWL